MKRIETNLESIIKAIITLSQYVFIDGRLFDEACGVTKEVSRFIECCKPRTKVIAIHCDMQQESISDATFAIYKDFGCTGVIVTPNEQYMKDSVFDYILSVGVRPQNVAVVCKESEMAAEMADSGFHAISRSMLYSVYNADSSVSWNDETPGVIYRKPNGSFYMYLGKGTIESNSMKIYIELPSYAGDPSGANSIEDYMAMVMALLWDHMLKVENITSGLAVRECESICSDIFTCTVVHILRNMLQHSIMWEE